MATSGIVGDTSTLRQTRVPFNAVHTVTGSAGHSHFALTSAVGFSHLVASRALVKLVGDTLRSQVIGPAAADKAVDAYIAVLPSASPAWPATAAQNMTVPGSAFSILCMWVRGSRDSCSFRKFPPSSNRLLT